MIDTTRKPRIVIATFNRGKVAEFASLLDGFVVVGLDAAGCPALPPEIGTTFEENARAKAWAAASLTGLFTLADDSGLEIDALGGAPGVLSARYGGPDLDDRGRCLKVLAELEDVPMERRTARFRCVLAAAHPSGDLGLDVPMFHGVCEGRIAERPSGEHGFGYDPIFMLPDGRTMAQLPSREKNKLSHRALAVRKFLQWSVPYHF